MCVHLLLRELQNYNSLLNNHRQENVGSHQRNIPHVQGQRGRSNEMVGGMKSCLESNCVPARNARRTQTNLVCTRTLRPHRDWARTVFEYLLWRYGSAVDCCRGRGSGCSRPRYDIALLEEVAINPTIEPPEFTQDWRNTLLEGTYKTLWASGPRRKEQEPHKRLTQTCPWVSRSLQQRRGWAVASCRARDTEGGSACMEIFEGSCHYLHYLHHSLASGKTTGREHNCTQQQKIGLKIYWAWLCPSEQDPVSPPPVSLSPQEASLSFLSLSIRGAKEWKPQLQKTDQTDPMEHSLV